MMSRRLLTTTQNRLAMNQTSTSIRSSYSFFFRQARNSQKLRIKFEMSRHTLATKTSVESGDAKKSKTDMSVWEQAQSPPNVITLTRMASTPILAYWITSEQYLLAIGGCALAAFSDFIDGYLAKNHGWSTVLGTYLDPLADKIFVNTLGVSLWYSGVLPTPLVALWATKDVLLLTGTAIALYRKNQSINFLKNSVTAQPLTVAPSMIGKVNTTLQFATLSLGILHPVAPFPPGVLNGLWYVHGHSCAAIS